MDESLENILDILDVVINQLEVIKSKILRFLHQDYNPDDNRFDINSNENNVSEGDVIENNESSSESIESSSGSFESSSENNEKSSEDEDYRADDGSDRISENSEALENSYDNSDSC